MAVEPLPSPRVRRYPPRASDTELALMRLYELAYAGFEGLDATPPESPHHPEGILAPAQYAGEYLRWWKPRNFLAKVVEEPVGYLGQLSPQLHLYRVEADGTRTRLDDEEDEDAKTLLGQLSTWVEKKLKPRQADVVLWQGLFGRSFAKVIYDPGVVTYQNELGETEELAVDPDVHVIPYPRMEGYAERAEAYFDSEDPDRVTTAVVYWTEEHRDAHGDPEEVRFAQLLYPDRIEWLRWVDGGWYLDPTRGVTGTGVDPHDWKVVPVAVCWNNGKSDVHDGIEAQEAINKDIYDMNALADQASFPQRWRKGVIPQGGWRRNPLTGEPETVPPLKSGPFVLWDVPTDGDVGQLDAADGGFLREKYQQDVLDLATLTNSVAVAKNLYSGGDAASGESKHTDTVQLLKPRIERKAEGLASFVRQVFAILKAMSESAEVRSALGFDLRPYDVEVRFEVAIDRDEAAEADRDFQDATAGFISRYTYLRRRGFSDAEARRELDRIAEQKDEEMERQAQQQERFNPLAGTVRGLAGALPRSPAAGPPNPSTSKPSGND